MLTADLVVARRRGTELIVRPLDDAARAEAARLAAEAIPILRQGLGRSREDIEADLALVEAPPRYQRLKDGLLKLLDDRCTWGVEEGVDPAELRRSVFLHAAGVRASLCPGDRFDRETVLTQVATARGSKPEAIDRALYADLKGKSLLAEFDAPSPAALVDIYERGQLAAVLLRAVRVKIDISCASAASLRALFRRLKFLGLLYTIERTAKGYELVVDGPLSLFGSITKYGHRMAQLVPLLEPFGAFSLEAEIRWGKGRVPLTFRAMAAGPSGEGGGLDDTQLPDDLAALVRGFRLLGNDWRVSPSRAVLDLPGTGLCVPDLVFERADETIYFEALGYWSRDAVFRRVDLVERGLSEKILFAASARLRVSEQLLGEDAPAALYVYKGAMKARAVADHLDRLSRRASR